MLRKTAQLDQSSYRHLRNWDNLQVRGRGLCHPYGYRQRCSVAPMNDIAVLVVYLVQLDYREALPAQRMPAIVDGDFSGTVALGSMSISRCERLKRPCRWQS
jgi:hypothetical protein